MLEETIKSLHDVREPLVRNDRGLKLELEKCAAFLGVTRFFWNLDIGIEFVY